MKKASRTHNTKLNLTTSIINKFALMLAAFVARTAFIRILGAEYTGINSLYSNILGILNVADLGLSSAMTFELYQALASNDHSKICSLVNSFKKIYFVIIAVILTIGAILIPFLPYIVNKSSIPNDRLVLYFILYLFDSVSSYFVVYRTIVITADQKSYINNIVTTVVRSVMYVMQIVYLYFTKNFFGYLIIQVAFSFLTNIILDVIAKKMYPYLTDKSLINPSLVDNRRVFKNSKATFIIRISGTILDQTDSIIISMMFGTIFVGYYSNYAMLIAYLNGLVWMVVSSVQASLGNYVTEKSTYQFYKMYENIDYVLSLVVTLFFVCFLCVIQDFITVWIGKDYVMPNLLVISILFSFYIQNIIQTNWLFLSTLGLFRQVQYSYLSSAIVNVFLSIVLGKLIGIPGIIFATGISRLVTIFWYESKEIFKSFHKEYKQYIFIQIRHAVTTIVISFFAFFLCLFVKSHNIFTIIIKLFISGTVALVIEFFIYHKTDAWSWMISRLLPSKKEIFERHGRG